MAKLSRNEIRVKKHKRIRYHISGTADKPRLTVFKSHKNFEAQLIDDVANKTIAFVSTLSLKIKSGGNIDAAAKVGDEMAAKIKSAKIKSITFDRSGYIFHGRVKAFAEAIRNKGVKF